MKYSMKLIWAFGMLHDSLSNVGITTGRFDRFSSSVYWHERTGLVKPTSSRKKWTKCWWTYLFEILGCYSFGPFLADVQRSARITDVSTFDQYSFDKAFILRLFQLFNRLEIEKTYMWKRRQNDLSIVKIPWRAAPRRTVPRRTVPRLTNLDIWACLRFG